MLWIKRRLWVWDDADGEWYSGANSSHQRDRTDGYIVIDCCWGWKAGTSASNKSSGQLHNEAFIRVNKTDFIYPAWHSQFQVLTHWVFRSEKAVVTWARLRPLVKLWTLFMLMELQLCSLTPKMFRDGAGRDTTSLCLIWTRKRENAWLMECYFTFSSVI